MKSLLKVLFILFLTICVGIHIYGIFTNNLPESNLSHILQIISYSLCLTSLLISNTQKIIIFCIGIIYPFSTHFYWAIKDYKLDGKLNWICILVIILLPIIGVSLKNNFWIKKTL